MLNLELLLLVLLLIMISSDVNQEEKQSVSCQQVKIFFWTWLFDCMKRIKSNSNYLDLGNVCFSISKRKTLLIANWELLYPEKLKYLWFSFIVTVPYCRSSSWNRKGRFFSLWIVVFCRNTLDLWWRLSSFRDKEWRSYN